MTSSLLAAAVALTSGLPIFALGEYLRERRERPLSNQHTPPPERTPHERI